MLTYDLLNSLAPVFCDMYFVVGLFSCHSVPQLIGSVKTAYEALQRVYNGDHDLGIRSCNKAKDEQRMLP